MRRRGRREVTLAIDDGPSSVTELLLSTLAETGHRAILFVLGCNVAGREPVLADAIRAGFALGNHSFSHPHFSAIEFEEARDEIVRTEAIVEQVYASTGIERPARWFRFPYLDSGGPHAVRLQRLLKELGFAAAPRAVPWHRRQFDWASTVRTHDWEVDSLEAFAHHVRQSLPGSIVEFHDKPGIVERYARALAEELVGLDLRATVPGELRDSRPPTAA